MDILTYGSLNKKVEEAKNVSGEKITESVNNYLDELGITVEFRKRKFALFVWYKNR